MYLKDRTVCLPWLCSNMPLHSMILIVEIGWPRAEVLTVVGFFVTPGMALVYKEVREELCPRLYRWLLGRGRPRENEENPTPTGVFPENDDLPPWSDLEEARELRAGVEQWMN